MIDNIIYKIDNKAYAGRLWDEAKVISFWFYPNVTLFKQLIKKRKKIECFFRVIRPVNILRSRFKIIIKPTFIWNFN